jgi:hypothetical protein
MPRSDFRLLPRSWWEPRSPGINNAKYTGFLILWDGTDRLPRNDRKESPLHTTQYPRSAQTSQCLGLPCTSFLTRPHWANPQTRLLVSSKLHTQKDTRKSSLHIFWLKLRTPFSPILHTTWRFHPVFFIQSLEYEFIWQNKWKWNGLTIELSQVFQTTF